MKIRPSHPEPDSSTAWRRVAVVGTSCSGKTTFASQLARQRGCVHIELDALHWGANWTAREEAEFRARTKEAVAAERWVCDGNYSIVRDLVWTRATDVIWLNYSLPLVFRRALQRTWRRVRTGERVYSGNRETFYRAYCSSESILWWVLRTHRRRRRQYPRLFRRAEFAHLRVTQFQRPQQAESFLSMLSLDAGGDDAANECALS